MDLAHIAWLASLALMLAACCWRDAVERRIPNDYVFAGALFALALAFSPAGTGGPNAAGGLAAGLLAGLILHFAGVMAAGDAKLLAAVGAFVGFPDIFAVLVYALVAGGVLAIAFAAAHGRLRSALANAASVVRHGAVAISAGMLPRGGDVSVGRERLPYAVAIAAGTAAHLALNGALAWRLQ